MSLTFKLAMLMRYAFMSGAGVVDDERIPENVQAAWTNFELRGATLVSYDSIVTELVNAKPAPVATEFDPNKVVPELLRKEAATLEGWATNGFPKNLEFVADMTQISASLQSCAYVFEQYAERERKAADAKQGT